MCQKIVIFYKGSAELIKFLYEIFMIPIRKAIFFFFKTFDPKSFQKWSIFWSGGPTGVELWKFTSGLNEEQQIMIFGPETYVNQFTVFLSELHDHVFEFWSF